jgi:15-cis-phytoene synthase
VDPDRFLQDPQPSREICRIVRRLLSEADRLYLRAEAGITALPLRARPGIWAARFIYAAIGDRLRARGLDSITQRARTGRAHKLAMIGRAGARTLGGTLMPQSAVLFASPLEEVRWLVDAAAVLQPWPGRTRALIDTLADLSRAEGALGARASRA